MDKNDVLTFERLKALQKKMEPNVHLAVNAKNLLSNWRELRKYGFTLRRVKGKSWVKVYLDNRYIADLYVTPFNNMSTSGMIMFETPKLEFPRSSFEPHTEGPNDFRWYPWIIPRYK